MTACWVPERLFWPFIKNGGLLDPNFGKRISGNIFDSKENTLRIILSLISVLLDHQFPFYKALSDGMLGFGATFLPFVKVRGLLDPNFEKNIARTFLITKRILKGLF